MDNVTPIRGAAGGRPSTSGMAHGEGVSVQFNRLELMQILGVYGRMVSAGLWRDYAIDMLRDQAVFSAFRRASERPDYQIVKRPDLARRQGAYALLSQHGGVLKRGHDLAALLHLVERKLIKAVEGE